MGIAILIVIAFIVGGGVLAYQYWWLPKQEKPIEESPSIKVLSPNGGESWMLGSTQTIRWISAGNISQVTISLVPIDSGIGTRVLGTVANSGSYSWTIPYCYLGNECSSNFEIPAGNYKIQISDSGISDQSDAPFSIVAASVCGGIQGIICPAGYECIYSGGSKFSPYPDATGTCTPISAKPSITVLSPNGGETWQAGSVQTIKWTSQNVPQGAHIRLGLYSTSLREGPVIAEDIPVVNNSYSWTVGLALGSGSFDPASDYKLTADVYTGPVCGLYPVMGGNCSATASILASDSSDAPFSIK